MSSSKKFIEEYPKTQLFNNTELYKTVLIFAQDPAAAIKGEMGAIPVFQKIIEKFEISLINSAYYKKIIVQIIILRSTQQIIKTIIASKEKGFICIYILSFLTYYLESKMSLEFDYLTIWNKQKIDDTFIDQITLIAKLVDDNLNELASKNNMTLASYCKRIETFKFLISRLEAVKFNLNSQFEKSLKDGGSYTKRLLEEKQSILKKEEKFENERILDLPKDYWIDLRKWCLENKKISIPESELLNFMERYSHSNKKFHPSPTQLKEIKSFLKKIDNI